MSFFVILCQEDLPLRAKTVYMYLKDLNNKYGECWPAIKSIAKDTSLSVSTVKRATADLICYGLLIKESRYREKSSNTSNQYYVL